MNPPEISRSAFRHQHGDGVFTEQWHAQVVALVELLVGQGKIAPKDWSLVLGAELDRRAAQGFPDTDANYYEAFLTALERILDKDQIATTVELNERESDWREAYLSTPHGQPVVLKR